ncbi:MAG: hypothetical protein ACRC8S_02905 [Fimbriiglobus sp.]
MKTWTIICHSCEDHFKFTGNWSEYERESLESRPCPTCQAYTLSCPEPTAPSVSRRSPHMLRNRRTTSSRA